ncbi:MAG TPA: TerB family tellurite resistance protein [Candidatus Limnocylindrales bacterium]|nr:TerB family tellurite resistance protein [Candidatus Limnocylindrales bacterium]
MSILRFLGLSSTESEKVSSAETQTVRKIVASLDAMPSERARFVASFAYILCRVARTDLHISDEEAAAMERIVIEKAGLTEDQAIVVLQIAKTQELLFGSTENFLVTREFNKLATREQKIALIDCLFAVSAADESISTAEDNEIVRICAELQLPREEVVEARGRYRKYLEVLKKIPVTEA